MGLAFFGFYFGRSVVDDMIYNNTKYDYAKTLSQQRDDITQSLANQSQDAELLPRTQLYCEDVINELDTQVAVSYTHLDVYKRQAFGFGNRLAHRIGYTVGIHYYSALAVSRGTAANLDK